VSGHWSTDEDAPFRAANQVHCSASHWDWMTSGWAKERNRSIRFIREQRSQRRHFEAPVWIGR
jgi:hypothetical protein